MAGPGGGPSRRSHTKSRKGCKTCKRRHIRCDETFPQCRNCTKHQVRCDYLDNPATTGGEEGGPSSQQPNLLWTPEIEQAVEHWQQTNEFPFPELNVYPAPQWSLLNKVDLRLLHHVAQITCDMQRSHTSRVTIWTTLMPKFLIASASHTFVMHAILSFLANHIAWTSQSQETRSLATQHRQLALKGLQEAISSFSQVNADAVLAASLLLAWQAIDWRNWASLMNGITTVIQTMQAWRDQSIFMDYLTEHASDRVRNFSESAVFRAPTDRHHDHLITLQNVYGSLVRLQPFLSQYEQESKWIDQLKSYVEQLKTSTAPQTADEQFKQLYALRKWLFWVPVTLLTSHPGDVLTMLVVAHFYAVGIAIEPMFPEVAADFCSNVALEPLNEIARIISQVSTTQAYNQVVQNAAIMMDFPRETANAYTTRMNWTRRQSDIQTSMQAQHLQGLESLNLDLANQIADQTIYHSLSPAFAPSPLHEGSPNLATSSVIPSHSAGSQRSSYLEVPPLTPHSAIDASRGYMVSNSIYSSPISAALASPGSAASVFAPGSTEEHGFGYGGVTNNWHGGFVPPPTVWT